MFGVELEKPMGQWKHSWESAREKAGVECRWHDLRHTFISRLAESPDVSEERALRDSNSRPSDP